MSEEIKISKQWIAKAKNDLLNADDWFMPTEEDAKEAREAASRVISWLQNAKPEILPNHP